MAHDYEDIDKLLRSPPHGYRAVCIGSHNCSWAVVEEPCGAIALDVYGHLIMKLTEPQAVLLAAEITVELRKHMN